MNLMYNFPMHWSLLVITSIFTASFSSILQRYLMKEDKSDPYLYPIVFNLMVSALIFIFTFFVGFKIPEDIKLLNLVYSTLLYASANYFLFNAFKISDAADVRISVSTRPFWVVLGSALWLGETVTTLHLLGTVLIVLGVSTVNFSKNTLKKVNKGVMYGLIAGLLYGLAFVNDGFLIKTWDVSSLMAVEFAIVPIFMLLIRPKYILKIPSFFNKKRTIAMLLLGVLYGTSAVSIFSAYRAGGNISLIAPLQQTSVIFTVFLGVLFLKEKKDLKKKILAASLALLGVFFLV